MPFPRHLIVEYTQKLAFNRLIVGSEGNISLRTKDGIYTTPSGKLKTDLRPQDIVLLDKEGNLLEGRRPSSEILMHLAIYEAREDVYAVIHAHPPYTLALELAGHDFSKIYLAEGALFLKEIAHVPFALPGTREVPEAMKPALLKSKVFVLSRHGAVTLGKDLAEAFNLMCVLEQVSRIVWRAKLLEPQLKPLSPEAIDRLQGLAS